MTAVQLALRVDAPEVDPQQEERDRIKDVIRETARQHDRTVSSNAVRDRLAGTVANSRLVGQAYSDLRREGRLVEVSAERSTDRAGGNAGKWIPVYRWEGPL